MTDSEVSDSNDARPRGGANHYPYTDHHERFGKYDADEIRGICKTLSEGDEVLVNKRERPLTVRNVEDCRDLGPMELGDTGVLFDLGPDGWCVHLEGHGTRYEIHVETEDSSKGHMLVWPSGEQAVGYLDVVSDGEIVEPTIRSSVTVEDLFGSDLR